MEQDVFDTSFWTLEVFRFRTKMQSMGLGMERRKKKRDEGEDEGVEPRTQTKKPKLPPKSANFPSFGEHLIEIKKKERKEKRKRKGKERRKEKRKRGKEEKRKGKDEKRKRGKEKRKGKEERKRGKDMRVQDLKKGFVNPAIAPLDRKSSISIKKIGNICGR